MNTDSLDQLKSLNYPVRIEFEPADNLYVADFLDLPGCSATGETVAEAHARAEKAKEDWLRLALEQGLPIPKPSTTEDYSGRVLLRIPTSLHAMVAERARVHGASLNQYLVHLISASTVQDEVTDKLEEMKGRMEKLDWRLAKLTTDLKRLSSYVSQASLRASTAVTGSIQYANVSAMTLNTQGFVTTQQGTLTGNMWDSIAGLGPEVYDLIGKSDVIVGAR